MQNINKLIIQEARPLPVIILADTSGSMFADNKISTLNSAIREMIDSLKGEDSLRAEIYFSIISFGGNRVTEYLPFSKVNEISLDEDLKAGGGTPMGEAFRITQELVEDKNIISSRSYAPTIILLSDGIPTDDWKNPLNSFLSSPRASKSFRIAMSIGAGEEGKKVLTEFLGDSNLPLFEANQARDIKKFFKFVTMSVSQRVQSVNPNQVIDTSIDDMDDDLDDFEF